MKENRILLCGILGGVIVASTLIFASWQWESVGRFRIGDVKFYIGLWDGSIAFGAHAFDSSPGDPIFHYDISEMEDYVKENFDYDGMWLFSHQNGSKHKDIGLVVPIWFVVMIASIIGMGMAYELLQRNKSKNANSSCDNEPLGQDEMKTAEQDDDGVRDK